MKNINFFNMLHFESHKPRAKMFVYSASVLLPCEIVTQVLIC